MAESNYIEACLGRGEDVLRKMSNWYFVEDKAII